MYCIVHIYILIKSIMIINMYVLTLLRNFWKLIAVQSIYFRVVCNSRYLGGEKYGVRKTTLPRLGIKFARYWNLESL